MALHILEATNGVVILVITFPPLLRIVLITVGSGTDVV